MLAEFAPFNSSFASPMTSIGANFEGVTACDGLTVLFSPMSSPSSSSSTNPSSSSPSTNPLPALSPLPAPFLSYPFNLSSLPPLPPPPSMSPQEFQHYSSLSLEQLEQEERHARAQANEKRVEMRSILGESYRDLLESAEKIEWMRGEAKLNLERLDDLLRQMDVHHHLHLPPALDEGVIQSQEWTCCLNAMERACLWIHTASSSSSAQSLPSVALAAASVDADAAAFPLIQALKEIHSAQAHRQRICAVLPGIFQATENNADAISVSASDNSASISIPMQQEWTRLLSSTRCILDDLPTFILHAAKDRLGDPNVLPVHICDALVAIILVSQCTVNEALSHLLSARLFRLGHILFATKHSIETFPRASHTKLVEECVTCIAQALQATLVHVHVFFGSRLNNKEEHVSDAGVARKQGNETTILDVAWRCNHVSASFGHIASASHVVDVNGLSHSLQKWFNVCSSLVSGSFGTTSPDYDQTEWPRWGTSLFSLSEVLKYLRSGLQVAGVRDCLLGVLTFADDVLWCTQIILCTTTESTLVRNKHQRPSNGQSADQPRSTVSPSLPVSGEDLDKKELTQRVRLLLFRDACDALADMHIAVSQDIPVYHTLWDSFFAPAFAVRSREVIALSFKKLQFEKTLDQMLKKCSRQSYDAQSHVLSSSNAVTCLPETSNENELDVLIQPFTNRLTKLAQTMQGLLDCKVAVMSRTIMKKGSMNIEHDDSFASFYFALVRFLDDDLLPLMSKLYKQSVDVMVGHLKKRLSSLEHGVWSTLDSPDQWRGPDCQLYVDQAVFIGRCCYSLQQQLLKLDLYRMLMKAVHAEPTAAHLATNTVIQRAFSATISAAFHIWTRYLATTLSEDLGHAFRTWQQKQVQIPPGFIARSFTTQALIAIQSLPPHESTSPNADVLKPDVQKKAAVSDSNHAPLPYAVPCAPSPHIVHFLYSLQQSLFRVPSTAMLDDTVGWLFTDASIAALNVFEPDNALDGSIDQNGYGVSVTLSSQLSGLPPQSRLQLLFDLVFLFSTLRLPASKSKSVSKKEPRANLISFISLLLQSLQSDADWNDKWSSILIAALQHVQAAINRQQLLLGVFLKRNPLPSLSPAELCGLDVSDVPTASASFTQLPLMPLSVNTTRLIPFSTSFYPSSAPSPKGSPSSMATVVTSHTSHVPSNSSLADTSQQHNNVRKVMPLAQVAQPIVSSQV